ncbi:carbohydrate ABC transporter permease [Saliterribacillus persicus]|uniref:Carbohydrate ABC transporter membrane protein 1 (CUT1 family) n=1 Tax=Saliterribacillus persicus TaxID=930114 RepID=A0A368YBQ0_9BACI|nr:sugar ABC transporter permease [Saliterribacillus persicus]RCW77545.1 carbohydrate ABC transporter membrane protein 1 (CUT1 family) [Saliterribacillus persicus]
MAAGSETKYSLQNEKNKKEQKKSKFRKKMIPYILVFPAVLFVIGVLGYAIIAGLLMSLFDIRLSFGDAPFVGLENYIYLFTDEIFLNSLFISLIFVFGSVVLGLALSLSFALSLYKCKRTGNFYKALALVPYLISGIATAIMFRFLFSGDVGLINLILKTVGLDAVNFLADPWWALLVCVLANVWFVCPFATLVLLSGIQSVDPELFDSAKIDGAHRIHILRKIILPLIAPMMGISLIWLSFASFNMFDVILPLTNGGPGRSTEVMALYMYNVAFGELQYSLGSAVMVIILFFNVVTSVIYLKIFNVNYAD